MKPIQPIALILWHYQQGSQLSKKKKYGSMEEWKYGSIRDKNYGIPINN